MSPQVYTAFSLLFTRTFRLGPTLPAAGVPNPETSRPRAIAFRGFCDGSGSFFALNFLFFFMDFGGVSVLPSSSRTSSVLAL